MATVALAVTDGMLPFELSLACEVFGADMTGSAASWYRLSVCGPDAVRVGRFRLEPDQGLDHLRRADTVIVPGWADVDTDPPAELVDAVRAAHDAGARVVSLCTGAFVLAAAGLLDGRRATTHWAHTQELARRHPRVTVDPDVLYVDDGSVLTSAGKAAAMDLCLHLVRLDHGSSVANTLARRLVVPPHRDGGQAQFVTTPVPAPDNHPLAELFPWVARRLDHPLTVEDMARRARMSSRNLSRHFRTGDRHDPAAMAAHATDTPRTGVAGDHGRHTGRHRGQHRHGHRHDAAPAFQPHGRCPPDTYRRTFRPHRPTPDGGRVPLSSISGGDLGPLP